MGRVQKTTQLEVDVGPKIDPLTTRMAQTTTGLHSILSSATAYRLFQGLLGGHATRAAFVRDQIRPFAGANILDIGCGPADVLDYLPATVNYRGFDISERYIAKGARPARRPRPVFRQGI